jgi:hypothetical protein
LAIARLGVSERIDSHGESIARSDLARLRWGGGVKSTGCRIRVARSPGLPACVAPTHEAPAHTRRAPAALRPRALAQPAPSAPPGARTSLSARSGRSPASS